MEEENYEWKREEVKTHCAARCPRCQGTLQTMEVHGHEQCVYCKSNILECCSGDTCETDVNLSINYKRS